MADIVNRELKILFLVFICFHFISSASRELAEDSNYGSLWEDKDSHHAVRSRRGLKSSSRKAKKENEVILPRPQVPGVQVPSVTVPPPTVGLIPRTATNAPNVGTSNVCLPNPCQNGGLCGTDSAGAYMCACTLGYRGKFCQEAMMKCDQIGCKSITDCLSAPNGAICLCKLGGMTRLCQSDIHSPSTWDKVRLVVSEQTIHTGEIIVGVFFGILALLAVLFGIHCHRVNVRRTIVKKRYKDILDQGIIPSEPPPDWCDISNDLLKKLICCKKGKTAFDAYKPKKSLSTIKQKEEELIQLLNSRAADFDNLPPSRLQYNTQGDFQDHLPVSKQYYPQSAPGDFYTVNRQQYTQDNSPPVSKRASTEQVINYSQRLDVNRDVNQHPSLTRVRPPVGNFKSGSRKSVRSIVDELNQSRNASIQRKRTAQDRLKKRYSKQSQHRFPVDGIATEYLTQLHKLGNMKKYSDLDRQRKGNNYDDYDDFEDEPVSESGYKHSNNSARIRHNSGKSRNTKAKSIKYSHQEPETRNCRKKKYKIDQTIGDNWENIKKSLTNRKNLTSNNAFTKTLQGSRSRPLSHELEESINDITETTDKFVTDSCSEDDSGLDKKLLIMINEENVMPAQPERWHPYSSRNGNENAKSGRLSNSSADHSVLYNDNFSYYQQQSRNPKCYTSTYAAEVAAKNFNVNKNTDNELKPPTHVEDPMFYGHLIDPSMKHDNLETTNWYWDHEPGNRIYNSDKGMPNRQGLTKATEDIDTRIKCFDTVFDCDNLSDNLYGNMQSDLSIKTKRCPCPADNEGLEKNSKEFITEKDGELKDKESEACMSKFIIDKYSWNGNDTRKAYQQSVNTYKSNDHDMSTDRLYVRSFDEDGEKRYFVSNEHAFRVDFKYQDYPEKNQENYVTDLENFPRECETLSEAQCSTPLQSGGQKGERVSNNMGNTPSINVGTPITPVGTPSTPVLSENTTLINASIGNVDAPVNVESNASETEVEL